MSNLFFSIKNGKLHFSHFTGGRGEPNVSFVNFTLMCIIIYTRMYIYLGVCEVVCTHIQGDPLFSYTEELLLSTKSNINNVLKSSRCLRVAYIWNNHNEIQLESKINKIAKILRV